MNEASFVRFSPASASALQFPELLRLVAAGAGTDIGGERVRALRPIADRDKLGHLRDLVTEIRTPLEEGALIGSFEEPLSFVPDLLADAGAGVDGPTLVLLAAVLETVTQARERILAADPALPRLGELVQKAPAGSSELARKVRARLDEGGRVRDDATPALARERRRIRALRDELYQELQGIALEHREDLSDDTIPVRGGRLVLSVRAAARASVPGLVHGASATGRTLYVEPMSVVEGNNRQQEAVAAEAAERERILTELVAEFRAARSEILDALAVLEELDLLQAIDRFARAGHSRVPDLSDANELRLVAARHPLLDPALAAVRERALGSAGHVGEVVPLDLELDPRTRALVITGPNAGGKTVALKTVGLLVAAAQSGLPVPAAAGTTMPVVEELIAVVGDEQDLMKDRSTFSARLLRLAEVWEAAVGGALVLVDELGSGTDPEEGAALSIALLEELLRAGALAVMTTHLIPLASAALELEGAGCAAMNFDSATGLPTYRLVSGAPGGSEALALAARLGLPSGWLDRANELLDDESRRLRALLAEVEALRERLSSELAAAERGRNEAEAALRALEAEREEAAAERRSIEQELRRELETFRAGVWNQLSAEVERLKGEVEAGRRRGLEAAAVEKLFAGGPNFATTEEGPAILEPGRLVKHRTLGWQGTVERVSGSDVEIRVAGKRVRSRREDLVDASGNRPEPAKPRPKVTASASDGGSPGELKLIGWRVESALDELDSFLDRALLGGRPEVRVVHGHGSGRLRNAVRAHLRGHPAVSAWRAGGPREGGDGATLITLKG